MTEDARKHEDRWVHSACSNCYAGNCPIRVHVVDGVVVKIEGDPNAPLFNGRICPKGNAAVMQLYDPYRVKAPLKRTNPVKGIGVDPGWMEITWEEAFDILVEKLTEVKKKNPKRLYAGGMDVHVLHFLHLLVAAFTGEARMGYFAGYGGMCGEPIHQMGPELHGSFIDMPDLRYCKYFINTGGSVGESWLAPTIQAQLIAERREKGELKVVVIDPRQSHTGAKADEWIPIRPATDCALFLAMMHTLVHELGIYDREFLKRQTSAPYLIGEDGNPLRDRESKKPLIWDPVDSRAKPYDDPTIKDLALEGAYHVETAVSETAAAVAANPGPQGKPGFQLFKEHIRQYTPEWAAPITTIPAATIRRLSKELGEAAQIGSTIVLEGKEYAYRPVAVAGYRGMNNHTNGPSTEHARVVLNMLLGACRAPGGLAAHDELLINAGAAWRYPYAVGEDGMTMGVTIPEIQHIEVPWKFPFQDVGMKALWPRGAFGVQSSVLGQIDPDKYGVDKENLCDVLIHWRLNPMMNIQDSRKVAEALAKIPFYVRFVTYLDESDDFADLVLPDTTHLERLGGANNHTWYLEGINLQQPAVAPLYNSRPAPDVFWELGERLGVKTGPMGMIMLANFRLGVFKPPWVFDPDRDYTREEYIDTLCRAIWDKDLAWFKEHGHNLRPVPPDRFYYRWGWNKARLPFYWYKLRAQGEELRRNMERDKVKEKVGLDPDWFCRQYNPLPTWEPSIIEKEDPKYDLYAFSFKTPITLHSTFPATNPWLLEIAERDPYTLRVWVNTETGKRKGLKDNDLVWIESSVGRVQGRVKLTECVHHEAVGFPGNTGHWAKHPMARGKGANLNSLLPFDLEHQAPLAPSAEGTARVRIYKAKDGTARGQP